MDPNLFKARLIAFYSSWINYKNRLWGNSDILLLFNPLSSHQPYLVSSAFFTWLLGHDLPATIAVFSPNCIYLLTSNWKSVLLRPLPDLSMESVGATLYLRPMYGTSETDFKLLDQIVREIRDSYEFRFGSGYNQRRTVVGYIQGEAPNPEDIWGGQNEEFRSVPVSGFFSLLNGDEDAMSKCGFRGVIQMEALTSEFEETLLLAPAGGTPPLEAIAAGKLRRAKLIEEEEDEEWVIVWSSMASTIPCMLLCFSILLGFMAIAAQARPGGQFHPCNTLIVFSTTTASYPLIDQNPNFDNQNPLFQSSPLPGGRFVTFIFTEVRRVVPTPTAVKSVSDPSILIHDQARIEEEKLPFPFGMYSSDVGASIRDRTNDILSVVESLLFGVGCGALTASIMYLIWSLFMPPNHFEFEDEDEIDDRDRDIDASTKKMGYVPIPVAKELLV